MYGAVMENAVPNRPLMSSALPPRSSSNSGTRRKASKPKLSVAKTILIVLSSLFAIFCVVVAAVAMFVVMPAYQQAREAASAQAIKDNLKRMGIGAYEFHGIHLRFPPTNSQDWGREVPPMSWHTHILPYIEHADLYVAVSDHTDWKDPAKKQVYAMEVPEFLHPAVETKTDNAGYAVAHFVSNSRIAPEGRGLKLVDITDGSSNTVMAGEINASFPAWGDPDNMRDAANGFGGGPDAFGSSDGPVMVLMLDGSVRMINPDLNLETARRIATPDDGELIGDF